MDLLIDKSFTVVLLDPRINADVKYVIKAVPVVFVNVMICLLGKWDVGC